MRRGAVFAFVVVFVAVFRTAFGARFAAAACAVFVFFAFAMCRHPSYCAPESARSCETGVRHQGGQCFVYDRHAMPPLMIGPFLVWLAGVGVIAFFGVRVVFGVWPWQMFK